jgi:hypothetical protein
VVKISGFDGSSIWLLHKKLSYVLRFSAKVARFRFSLLTSIRAVSFVFIACCLAVLTLFSALLSLVFGVLEPVAFMLLVWLL